MLSHVARIFSLSASQSTPVCFRISPMRESLPCMKATKSSISRAMTRNTAISISVDARMLFTRLSTVPRPDAILGRFIAARIVPPMTASSFRAFCVPPSRFVMEARRGVIRRTRSMPAADTFLMPLTIILVKPRASSISLPTSDQSSFTPSRASETASIDFMAEMIAPMEKPMPIAPRAFVAVSLSAWMLSSALLSVFLSTS